ncbi:hypothetical protein PCANC_09442 [Puccinia coronata f. sp. avenae]|uniref:Uncharacterized protein n=1 Tax=Puccinia coronata f. sp. avenae TaxID=200324 RepID=A0A2N5SUI1_9BASI|nr:hypothetical protein PCANC_09442 [Puccinia coronata f. sp. avenae]
MQGLLSFIGASLGPKGSVVVISEMARDIAGIWPFASLLKSAQLSSDVSHSQTSSSTLHGSISNSCWEHMVKTIARYQQVSQMSQTHNPPLSAPPSGVTQFTTPPDFKFAQLS